MSNVIFAAFAVLAVSPLLISWRLKAKGLRLDVDPCSKEWLGELWYRDGRAK